LGFYTQLLIIKRTLFFYLVKTNLKIYKQKNKIKGDINDSWY